MYPCPDLSLDGIRALTDETGMFQHTKFSIIDRREGYTTDDNARALIAALRYHKIYGAPGALRLAQIYLSFLLYMQRNDGSFHNVIGFDRRYKDELESEDCTGRALWASGSILCSNTPDEMKILAQEVFDRGLPSSRGFTSPRSKAFVILGLCSYHEVFPDDVNLLKNIEKLADDLVNQYRVEAEEDWSWFEAYLTYANPRLPQALFDAYASTNNREYLEVAVDSLDFLIENQFPDDVFMPIGTDGWYQKHGEKATFDQQPLEASCMVEAAVTALDATSDKDYQRIAQTAFEWYHGRNIHETPLVNPVTCICYDGITPEGLNRNQGAESTLSYYLAYLRLKEKNII